MDGKRRSTTDEIPSETQSAVDLDETAESRDGEGKVLVTTVPVGSDGDGDEESRTGKADKGEEMASRSAEGWMGVGTASTRKRRSLRGGGGGGRKAVRDPGCRETGREAQTDGTETVADDPGFADDCAVVGSGGEGSESEAWAIRPFRGQAAACKCKCKSRP